MTEGLVEFALQILRLAIPDENGVTLRDTLEAVETMGGTVPELHPEYTGPLEALYFVDLYQSIGAGRQSGGLGGLSPLSHLDILAWCLLNGTGLSELELRIVRAIDHAFVREVRKSKPKAEVKKDARPR